MGKMSSCENVYFDNGPYDKLLSYLMGLDRSQLEEFKLCLQAPELLLENFQKIPWANLKASDPINLLSLLSEYFSERQIWEVTLSIFENMNLTPLCVEVRARLNGEWVHGREGGTDGRTDGRMDGREGQTSMCLVLMGTRRLLLDFYGGLPNS